MSTLLNTLFAALFSTALSPNAETQVTTVPERHMEVTVATEEAHCKDYKIYCYLQEDPSSAPS